ncbi:MAG: S8 family serine peptidase [Cyclonatronaceae bacterium]
MKKTYNLFSHPILPHFPGSVCSKSLIALSVLLLLFAAPVEAQRPGTFDTALAVEVRFAEDALPQARGQLMSSAIRRDIAKVERLIPIQDTALQELRARGQQRSGRAVPALEAWYRVIAKEGTDMDAFVAGLLSLPFVEIAEMAPVPAPPPYYPVEETVETAIFDHEPTPLFEDLQGYLEEADDGINGQNGINARYAWDYPGGNGSGFTVYDVEYSWNQTHEDLSKAAGVTILVPDGHTQRDPYDSRDHGTAVLGELVGDNDDKGVTGISWGADVGLAAAATFDKNNIERYNPGLAIALAAADGKPGDVILIEQQTCVCELTCPGNGDQTGLGPTEWIQSAFDAIVTATAAGIIVVQAAGNGDVDLDQEGCKGRFDPDDPDNYSGAIIVGAGSSTTRSRLDFSSYGSRVDLQGWGQNVMTTGYGTHYSNHDQPNNEDFWYRRGFGGTSGASPIVSGAVLNLQGINFAAHGTVLSASEVLTILQDTGTPQGGDTSENIGPLPNLRLAIAEIINVPPVADAGADQTVECDCFDGAEVTLDGSGSFDDNGDPLTYTWRIGADVIAGPSASPTANVTLSLGVHVVTLTVTDPDGLSDTDNVTITIEDTTPPVVTLLGDDPVTLECGVDDYVEFGATISDICDPNPVLVIDASDVDTHTPGDYEVDYTGTDASTNSVTEKRTVNVVDTTPPTITVNSEPMVLWSPKHDYRTLALADLDIEVGDFCDQTLTPEDVVIVSVTSDEPENGEEDGNTVDDMVIGGSCNTVQLRAERDGTANGRVYTLRLELMDASGNVGFTNYEVHVPVSQRPGSMAIADDPVYTVSAESCEPVLAASVSDAAGSDSEDQIQADFSESPDTETELPDAFELGQNYPNPFNPATVITYALPEASPVRLSVYNMLGQEVAILVNEHKGAGRFEARFDAAAFPSGVYIYAISAGSFRTSRMMVLVK